ncbi:sigma factor, partial [Rhizobium ruizarguesonis]
RLMSSSGASARLSGEAEELVQEIMIVLWHKAELYDATRSSLSTWLFRIARNRRIDMQRRAKTRIFDETDPALQPPAD